MPETRQFQELRDRVVEKWDDKPSASKAEEAEILVTDDEQELVDILNVLSSKHILYLYP